MIENRKTAKNKHYQALPNWFVVAIDAVAKHRVTGEPLKAAVSSLLKARHLGQAERKQVTELVFSWSRHREQLVSLTQGIAKDLGNTHLTPRDKDVLELALIANSLNLADSVILALLPEAYRNVEISNETIWPKWFAEKVTRDYGAERGLNLLNALKQRSVPVIALDRRFDIEPDLLKFADENQIQLEPSPLISNAWRVISGRLDFDKLPKALKPYVWLMDDSSQVAASFVGAIDSQHVLDLCAGGGGKTRYLTQTNAQIWAADISETRLNSSKKRILPEDHVHWVVADATNTRFPEASFDWILVDAPCTGSGTIRRAPDLLSRLNPESIAEYTQKQVAIAKAATRLLKSGGTLVYATCSIFPEENQEVIAQLLKEQSDLSPVPLNSIRTPNLKISASELSSHALQLLPSEHNCDGFFIAALKRS